jgi:drug/metabolite transporter (DMT)-like permease
MTTVLLALASAAAYGASDFVGGFVSRRTPAWGVAFVVQLVSALAVLAAMVVVDRQAPSTHDVLWGLLGGVGSGVGISFLFRGFAAGRMSVVAPLSAVGAAVIPVVVGLLTGERPGLLVLAGVVVAVPGIWLVSAGETAPGEDAGAARSLSDSGVLDGALAGLGFAVTFIGLGNLDPDPGLWPLVASQAMSAVTVIVLATLMGVRLFPVARAAWRAWPGGPLGSLALVLYRAATAAGLMTVAVVVTSLYPAMTILLAVLLLKEHITRLQTAGLVLCGLCVALVAGG